MLSIVPVQKVGLMLTYAADNCMRTSRRGYTGLSLGSGQQRTCIAWRVFYGCIVRLDNCLWVVCRGITVMNMHKFAHVLEELLGECAAIISEQVIWWAVVKCPVVGKVAWSFYG